MSVVKRRIPHEIKAYKSTMFFGLTTRQVICAVIALILVVPTVFLNRNVLHLDDDLFGYLIMLEVIPPAACGWLSYNDMPIEQIAVKLFYFYFGCRNRKWKWHTDEAKIHEAVAKLEFEEIAKARKEELEEEKRRQKEEKKAARKAVKTAKAGKEKKKNVRTVRSKN